MSLASLLMRARVLGRMSDSQYLTAVNTASSRWRRVEPVPVGRPEQPEMLSWLLQTEAGARGNVGNAGGGRGALAAATAD